MIKLTINKKVYNLEVDPQMPLLWALRDVAGLTGTKYGCGMAQCGACTVHLNGDAVRSCLLPVAAATGKEVTTIEGLSENNNHPVQQAWMEMDVAQCGYCQAGQIMTAAALLRKNSNPSNEDIVNAMQGNICRCGTYLRIQKAVNRAAELQKKK
jgi:isoquinoline 1-oxidoreductase alpha subunit